MSSLFETYHPYADWLAAGRQAETIDSAIAFLQVIKKTSQSLYSASPKGTPFYILGTAAAQCHDYQSASFYFDAAVSEDLRHYPGKSERCCSYGSTTPTQISVLSDL
jgi:hypothetical protein